MGRRVETKRTRKVKEGPFFCYFFSVLLVGSLFSVSGNGEARKEGAEIRDGMLVAAREVTCHADVSALEMRSSRRWTDG